MHFRAELIVYIRRCATRAFSLAQNLGTRSVADGVSTLGLLLVLLLIYYALPVVCTSRYILLAKRSILTITPWFFVTNYQNKGTVGCSSSMVLGSGTSTAARCYYHIFGSVIIIRALSVAPYQLIVACCDMCLAR